MANPCVPPPALLVVAAFSRHDAALAWACNRLQQEFGPIGQKGHLYQFCHTKYYEREMGQGLAKQLVAFQQLVCQEQLASIKLRTNHLEMELAAAAQFPESRPLNLDPGLLTLGKFLLATTKDQSHRIYLTDGIFAEVTLRFQDGHYEPWPWTYADYRENSVRASLNGFRDYYKHLLTADS